MKKLHTVRGYQNQIYYAKKSDTGDKICKLSIDYYTKLVTKTDVFQLPGSKIFVLEADNGILLDH